MAVLARRVAGKAAGRPAARRPGLGRRASVTAVTTTPSQRKYLIPGISRSSDRPAIGAALRVGYGAICYSWPWRARATYFATAAISSGVILSLNDFMSSPLPLVRTFTTESSVRFRDERGVERRDLRELLLHGHRRSAEHAVALLALFVVDCLAVRGLGAAGRLRLRPRTPDRRGQGVSSSLLLGFCQFGERVDELGLLRARRWDRAASHEVAGELLDLLVGERRRTEDSASSSSGGIAVDSRGSCESMRRSA